MRKIFSHNIIKRGGDCRAGGHGRGRKRRMKDENGFQEHRSRKGTDLSMRRLDREVRPAPTLRGFT